MNLQAQKSLEPHEKCCDPFEADVGYLLPSAI